MASAISLRTLGSVELEDAASGAVRSLLAEPLRTAFLVYLVIATPRDFHQRDILLTLFWPDDDEPEALDALRQVITALRGMLGAAAIVDRGDEAFGVNRDLVSCDAVEFERALAAGRWEEALELYRGPFFHGFQTSDAEPELDRWVVSTRARLAQGYAHALEHMADAREADGDPRGAAVWLRRLVDLNPYDQRATDRLARVLGAD